MPDENFILLLWKKLLWTPVISPGGAHGLTSYAVDSQFSSVGFKIVRVRNGIIRGFCYDLDIVIVWLFKNPIPRTNSSVNRIVLHWFQGLATSIHRTQGFSFFADGDSDGMFIAIWESRKNGNYFDTVPQAKLGDYWRFIAAPLDRRGPWTGFHAMQAYIPLYVEPTGVVTPHGAHWVALEDGKVMECFTWIFDA